MRSSPVFMRLLCGLWLLALAGSWAPHDHDHAYAYDRAYEQAYEQTYEQPHATAHGADPDRLESAWGGGRPASREGVSSDDAHHEHSVVSHELGSDCGLCRSAEERRADRLGRAPRLDGLDGGFPRGGEHRDRLRSILFERLQPSRAPPIV